MLPPHHPARRVRLARGVRRLHLASPHCANNVTSDHVQRPERIGQRRLAITDALPVRTLRDVGGLEEEQFIICAFAFTTSKMCTGSESNCEQDTHEM